MERSAAADASAGYGVTCEPGNIFPACQNHLHAALNLHTALRERRAAKRAKRPTAAVAAAPAASVAPAARGAGGERARVTGVGNGTGNISASNITAGWIDFAFTRGGAIWTKPDGLLHNHGTFKVRCAAPLME